MLDFPRVKNDHKLFKVFKQMMIFIFKKYQNYHARNDHNWMMRNSLTMLGLGNGTVSSWGEPADQPWQLRCLNLPPFLSL